MSNGDPTKRCRACSGIGTIPTVVFIPCPSCATDSPSARSRCPTCSGSGLAPLEADDACPKCRGAGIVGTGEATTA